MSLMFIFVQMMNISYFHLERFKIVLTVKKANWLHMLVGKRSFGSLTLSLLKRLQPSDVVYTFGADQWLMVYVVDTTLS
jgi:hypothetical protein